MPRKLKILFVLTSGMMFLAQVHARANLTVTTRSGERYELQQMRILVDPKYDYGLGYMAHEFQLILIRQTGSLFVTGIPLRHLVSGGLDSRDRFCVILDDNSTVRGTLLTGVWGQDVCVEAQTIAGLDVADPANLPEVSWREQTHWNVRVEDKEGRPQNLLDTFILDVFAVEAEGKDAAPRKEMGFEQRGLNLIVPVSQITQIAMPADTGLHSLKLTQATLDGEIRLWSTARGRQFEFGALDRDDYLVGSYGVTYRMLPLNCVKTCTSTSPPIEYVQEPARRCIELTDRSTNKSLIIHEPNLDLTLEKEDDLLAAIGGFLLAVGSDERVGIPLETIRSVTPALNGRVVVETSEGGVFAGRPLTGLTGIIGGGRVKLAPDVLTRSRALFKGQWDSDSSTMVTPTYIHADVWLDSGSRRALRNIFILDRTTEQGFVRLAQGVCFPLYDGEVRQLVELAFCRVIEKKQPLGKEWSIDTLLGETVCGEPGFRSPDGSSVFGRPDTMDFVVGFDRKALDFVPVNRITRMVIELDPLCEKPQYKYRSRGMLHFHKGRTLEAYNYRFTLPQDLLIARVFGGPTKAYFQCADGSIRIVEMNTIRKITRETDSENKDFFTVTGLLPPFRASVCSPIEAHTSQGSIAVMPAGLQTLEFSEVPSAEKSTASPKEPSVALHITTKAGTTIHFRRCWLADVLRSLEDVQIHFDGRVRLIDQEKAQDLRINHIKEIRFSEDGSSQYGGTPCIVRLREGPEITAELQLAGACSDETIFWGPVNDDAIVGFQNEDCIEVVPLKIIETIKLLE